MYNVFWNGMSGETIPDSIIEATVTQRLADWKAAGKPDTSVIVGNLDLHTMYRVAIARGLIDRSEICFWHAGEIVELASNLSFLNWAVDANRKRTERLMELMLYNPTAPS